MPIYSKPTKELMKEFVTDEVKPGQIFSKKQVVDWFGKRYPDIKANTVQMHVDGMSVNSTSRKHHPSIKPGSGHDLFYKLGPTQYRLWDQSTDQQPIYREGMPSGVTDSVVDDSVDDQIEAPSSAEFAFERDLRNYLSKNLNSLEAGLKLYHDEEFSGIEFPVGGRFIDILAIDVSGRFVVIELKVSRGYDRVVGQILRYMAWVKKHMSVEQDVRGVIVASEVTDDLKLATSMIQNVRLFEYAIAMKLTQVELTVG